ncbi:MAG: hypothetical protein H0W86_11185, partial [Armatimonadetes bacterium]|nr:hypothetical protein [Armatimonadota bacterium]
MIARANTGRAQGAMERLFAAAVALPADVRFNLCIHTEQIADRSVFERLDAFGKWWLETSGVSAVLAIIPFSNPQTALFSERMQCAESVFVERVHTLARHSEIGYHGHFFRETAVDDPAERRPLDATLSADDTWRSLWAGRLTPIGVVNHDERAVGEQIDRDIGWFKNH